MTRYFYNKEENHLLVDTETTGLNPKINSILTFYGVVLDEEFNPISKPLNLKLKPNNGEFILYDDNDKNFVFEPEKYGRYVSVGALKKNKIDLKEHYKQAITIEEGGNKLYNYLIKFTDRKRLKLIGQNVEFDKQFMIQGGLVRSWERYFGRTVSDTKTNATLLQQAGLYPSDKGLSLTTICEHYGIKVENAHTAEADALMTLQCLMKQIDLLKEYKRVYNIYQKQQLKNTKNEENVNILQ